MDKTVFNKFGFMQGRLSPIYNNKIQNFPWRHWKKELNLCKKIGLNRIEWTLDYPNLLKNPLISNPKNTFKILKDKNIKMNSITCDFFMQKPFFFKKFLNEKKIIEQIVNNFKKKKIILVIPLVDKSSIKNTKQEKEIVKFFLFIHKKYLKRSNIIVCFESDFKVKKLKKFILKFPKKNFGINYDTGNSASLGFNCKNELENLKDRIYNIHIKDRKFAGNTVRLGYGDFNFKIFFKNIKKTNYKGNFILQTARSKNGKHMLELKKNLKFLKNVI
tara:strand:+ start:410 stop:1231 length:822 start_codon:yes stop_codon:yes gene_type:complete